MWVRVNVKVGVSRASTRLDGVIRIDSAMSQVVCVKLES